MHLEKDAALADLLKTAPALGIKGLLGIAALSAGGGALAGLGGYGAYKQFQDSDDKIDSKLVEKKQYEDAIRELQRAAQSQQGGGMYA